MLSRIILPVVRRNILARCYCSTETTPVTTLTPSLEEEPQLSSSSQTFASLLRNSKFIQMGDPVGKVVVGKIYHVVDEDLYIDIGTKFPCVCTLPRGRNSQQMYTRGTEVRVLVKKLEMSQKFLGFDQEMPLLESEGVLLGLYKKQSL